jgi:hypothetical protein
MIIKSQHLFEQAIYGSIIYNMLDMNDYVQYLNHDDITIAKAIQLFKAKQTKPTLNDKDRTTKTDSRKKKAAYHRGTFSLQPKHLPFCA